MRAEGDPPSAGGGSGSGSGNASLRSTASLIAAAGPPQQDHHLFHHHHLLHHHHHQEEEKDWEDGSSGHQSDAESHAEGTEPFPEHEKAAVIGIALPYPPPPEATDNTASNSDSAPTHRRPSWSRRFGRYWRGDLGSETGDSRADTGEPGSAASQEKAAEPEGKPESTVIAEEPIELPSDDWRQLSKVISVARSAQGNVSERRRSSHRVDEKKAIRPGVYFRSRRVRDGERDTSWLQQNKDPRQKWLSIIPLAGLFLGFCVAGVYIYLGYRSVPVNSYCLVYEDDFSAPHLNKDVWLQEVQVGGFGNGQFDETTADEENVFIKDHMLHIQPTLQDEYLMTHNATVNLLDRGTCTANTWADCVAVTNTTNGTVVNPVKSGRINTSRGANLRFGRVEVVAKLPQGDWLWPAIWLYPTNSEYGTWPASGEIDIAESRGNNWTYPLSGNDIISSTLHWGPTTSSDAWWRTYHKQKALHSTFSERFHTFGLEWNEKYLYTYLDSRLLQVLYHKFGTPFWELGSFAGLSLSTAGNIWWNGTIAAPFDQDFFLILDVAVGGTNNWFQDGLAGKPWADQSQFAKKQFWEARDQWYPTWQNPNGPAMQVKSVKMWQQKGYNGCGDNARPVG
ncbi:hypothetical protein A1O3_05011 [Capronia epimyces CBS 606.96]|uniref:GH16 domain-containing protein n=1 Tax=Capronia epimyces CBS 606.96 TaxID=1182542 RepID=W9YQ30_9EURO|nr:uncharacterized protein A1O3_05011 [Capronia epimyces CBS 606.96]EXJ84344.1 hypothetical protein A1O3_05011 [Capronia epimyces CBS 606.96]